MSLTCTSLEEALAGKEIPQDIRRSLVLIDVQHLSLEGHVRHGQLVVHAGVGEELQDIFRELLVHRFPITKVVPIVHYGWDDDASIVDNNTSAFNYRTIAGTDRLSNHAFGLAIDINPLWNPLVRDGVIEPPGEPYDVKRPGTVCADGPVVAVFKKHGWTWGGDWVDLKDWQHFEKQL